MASVSRLTTTRRRSSRDVARWPRMSSTSFWAVVLLTALLVLYCVGVTGGRSVSLPPRLPCLTHHNNTMTACDWSVDRLIGNRLSCKGPLSIHLTGSADVRRRTQDLYFRLSPDINIQRAYDPPSLPTPCGLLRGEEEREGGGEERRREEGRGKERRAQEEREGRRGERRGDEEREEGRGKERRAQEERRREEGREGEIRRERR
ncbi:hypothetical protein NHX12_020906 [Muraenolepis orangiensis]|uniref:Uncharacterized protein n=1 Tax=Muraenolepis orangiensis TaxID=630683 RepID=A0A9Q0IVK4_9TELE|nr:hypothetical protein NHX12_020906 [Muraenolepis orangiensis]